MKLKPRSFPRAVRRPPFPSDSDDVMLSSYSNGTVTNAHNYATWYGKLSSGLYLSLLRTLSFSIPDSGRVGDKGRELLGGLRGMRGDVVLIDRPSDDKRETVNEGRIVKYVFTMNDELSLEESGAGQKKEG